MHKRENRFSSRSLSMLFILVCFTAGICIQTPFRATCQLCASPPLPSSPVRSSRLQSYHPDTFGYNACARTMCLSEPKKAVRFNDGRFATILG